MKQRVGSCQCEACGKGFRSLSSFDMHRTGSYAAAKKPCTRRCLSTEEMVAEGMRQAPNGARVTGIDYSEDTDAA